MSQKKPMVEFAQKVVKPLKPKTFQKKAYCTTFNSERKAFDLLVIHVNIEMMETKIEIIKLKTDNPAVALMEVNKKNAEDFFKEGRKHGK